MALMMKVKVKEQAGRHEGPRRPSCGRLRFVSVLLRDLRVALGRMEGRGRIQSCFVLSELSHGDGDGEASPHAVAILHATLRV